jgi:pyruvate,water dikinase
MHPVRRDMIGQDEPCDPLHSQSGPGIAWTTAHIDESYPGVVTPLTWTFRSPATERAARRAYIDLGVLPRGASLSPSRIDDAMLAVFYGRVAVNVNVNRDLADRMPVLDGDQVEVAALGNVRARTKSRPNVAQRAVTNVMVGWRFGNVGRRSERYLQEQRQWWTSAVRDRDRDPATRLLEAQKRFEGGFALHTIASLRAAVALGLVARIAVKAGRPELIPALLGRSEVEEQSMIDDLCSVASGTTTIARFLSQHGYHAAADGEISSLAWREDEQLINVMSAKYRNGKVSARSRENASSERDAMRQIIDAVAPTSRPYARSVIALATRALPVREVGKAAFLMALDGARAAARDLGDSLAQRGYLDVPADVFLLTLDELATKPTSDLARAARHRADRIAHYDTLRVPRAWVGDPTPLPAEYRLETDASRRKVVGVCASPGVAEGTIRVARSLSETESVELGDILVCHTTDPSWVTVFPLLAGLVVDHGSIMSHGAIVARSFGIPCLVATNDGTATVTSGQEGRLDASAGHLIITEPTSAP